MQDLVSLFEHEGCEDARTYIASGNVVFSSSQRVANKLPKRIAAAISRSRGFTPSVLVLSAAELATSIAKNPFPAAVENPKSVYDLHATILRLVGLDFEKLTYRFNGRDMRLTDEHGHLIPEVLG